MVDRMLLSLPALTCYDELRRKVLFSSNMTKYTPELLREMFIIADSRSEDWEGNTFGYRERKGHRARMVAVHKVGSNTDLWTRSRHPSQEVMVTTIVVGIILNVISRIWMESRTQEQIMRVQAGHHWNKESQKIGTMKVKVHKSVKS